MDLDLDRDEQLTFATSIITAVDEANQDRKKYLNRVAEKRVRRLSEIHEDNLKKIDAPFVYQ